MRHLTSILCLFTASLLASPPVPDSGSLSSTNASYDGNALLLTGHVILDHGLGKMTAEEASLQRQESGKEFPFSLINLRKEVVLSLRNNAQISCDSADLDFTTLKGILQANANEKVVYQDLIQKKKGKDPVSVKMMGNVIELNFFKLSSDAKKAEYDVETVLAKENVVIDYANLFYLNADRAIFRKQGAEFQGVITAYPQDENSKCRLIHEKDVIDADAIDLDLNTSKISLLHPIGVLCSSLIPQQQTGDMRFSSNHLLWDHQKNLLILKGSIKVDSDVMGILTASDELHMEQTVVKDKRALKSIHVKGPSSLLYRDQTKELTHKILSHGVVHIDREKLFSSFESPTVDGVVAKEKQLYYEEEELGVFADNASMEYSLSSNLLQPVSLSLKGNVRLSTHDTQKPLRCASADRLNYSLTTRTLILSANPGNKVLFWDESQGMHLSAPEIHITLDPLSKQQTVKGIGHVQFSFTPDEQTKLSELFPQLKMSHE